MVCDIFWYLAKSIVQIYENYIYLTNSVASVKIYQWYSWQIVKILNC